MSKVKFYPNPNRSSNITSEKYVPQYKEHGVQPMPVKGFGGVIPNVPSYNQSMIDPANNPRIRSQSGSPYATTDDFDDVTSLAEQDMADLGVSWNFSKESSYDVFDGISFEEDIDNMIEDFKEERVNEDHINQENDSYVLIFDENILKIGDLSSIEQVINELISGTHEMSLGKKINIEDLVLLKRVNIKYGLFFEE